MKQGNQTETRAAILWELKQRGDVNENHEGGNAVAALRKRLADRGFVPSGSSVINNSLQALERVGNVGLLRGQNRPLRIYLTNLPDPMPPNPLNEDDAPGENLASVALPGSSPDPGGATLPFPPSAIAALPMQARVDLGIACLESVRSDLEAIRNRVG